MKAILINWRRLVSCVVFVGLSLTIWVKPALACEQYQCNASSQSEDDYLVCVKDKKSCLESKISETQAKQVTLANTISIVNGQIAVQELQINQTLAEIAKLEREVTQLAIRISDLNMSLDQLTSLLLERVREQYKRRAATSVRWVFVSESLQRLVRDQRYIQAASIQTAGVMAQAETQRIEFDEQKLLKEQKQAAVEAKRKQLESQRVTLEKQRQEQQYLLTETRNNEAKFQNELARTLAELSAIQSIIAGRGNESEVGNVKTGDNIATIIQGASACSTGTHLHFEVNVDGDTRNPANYLKSADIAWSNQPDEPFGFSGNWDWPVYDPAQITQGYGDSWYARVKRAYGGSGHTGIDMVGKTGDSRVRAVQDGKLFRGSISCGGGLLRYVRLQHNGSSANTYYLHINY